MRPADRANSAAAGSTQSLCACLHMRRRPGLPGLIAQSVGSPGKSGLRRPRSSRIYLQLSGSVWQLSNWPSGRLNVY